MDGTVIVALAGLVGTAVAPWITGRIQRSSDRQRVELERSERDLEERRALLDHAAEAASAYIGAVGNVAARAAFTETWDKESFDKAVDPSIAAKADAYRINRRLVIRLGRTSPVVTTFGLVLKRCDEDFAPNAKSLRVTGAADPLQDRMKLLSEDEGRGALRWHAYEDFLDAAAALVGDYTARTSGDQ